MGRARSEVERPQSFDLGEQADILTARFKGGLSRIAQGATRGAKRVKGAAHDLRALPAVQHAVAARDRGNLEAAFWLLNEAFGQQPDAEVALHYWDVALSLGRVDIAAEAGVALVESQASSGAPELAAQHWLELVKEAPDVLVSPAAIATLLPALKQRLTDTAGDAAEDRETLAGYLRRAVRHAVDPRNTGLHPGVALRIFEQGRELNPEAARRAAEAALESPHLHEAKRERLETWLSGKPLEDRPSASQPAPAQAPAAESSAPSGGLSQDEIVAAARRLPASRPVEESESEPEAEPAGSGPRIQPARLTAIDDEGLQLEGSPLSRLEWEEVEAVAVAELMGLEDGTVAVVDLVLNWSQRASEKLEIVRLRASELALDELVTRKHALGSDFAALMGDIMERTQAVPLPDPESALGTRITCFETPELYERVALRLPG